MTKEHPTTLTFAIEESVWLNKGQKIQDVLSLGLEPDIRIEEKADDIFIKGGLYLKGEYRPLETDDESEREERNHLQYVEETTINNEGIGEIQHYFPIDVSIPQNRIHHLDDVYVQVDGFDYDLPEPGCIQLAADVSISGMKELEEENREQKEVDQARLEPFDSYEDETRVVQENKQESVPVIKETRNADEKREEQEEENKLETNGRGEQENDLNLNTQIENDASADIPKQTEENLDNSLVRSSNEESKDETPASVGKAESVDRYEQAETPDNTSPIESAEETVEEEKQQVSSTEDSPQQEDGEKMPGGAILNFEPRKESQEDPEAAEDDVAEENKAEELEEEEETHTHRKENALYLTKMLTHGEEDFTRLKMCIVQDNESLETIAERYGLTSSHLLRVNRLDSENVEEGQILYIPVTGSRTNES